MVRTNDLEALRERLTASPDLSAMVNEVDEAGYTPLYYAVSGHEPNVEIVRLLLESGAAPGFVKIQTFPGFDSDFGEFAETVEGTDDELAEMLRSLPNDLVSPGPTEFREPLLREALNGESVEVIRLLQQHGADLFYRSPEGYTAMIDAAYGDGNRLPIIRYLIEQGGDVSSETEDSESAASVLYHRGQFEALEELLRAGADESVLRWTDLHRAVAIGTAEDFEQTIASGISFEAFDQ